MNYLNTILIALIAAIMLTTGYGARYINPPHTENTLIFEEYVEDIIPGELLIIPIRIAAADNDRDTLLKLMDKSKAQLTHYLNDHNILQKDIEYLPAVFNDRKIDMVQNDPMKRYHMEHNVLIKTDNINMMEQILRGVPDMSTNEVLFSSYYYYVQNVSVFKDINKLKNKLQSQGLKMINEKAESAAKELRRKINGITTVKRGALEMGTNDWMSNNRIIKMKLEIHYSLK